MIIFLALVLIILMILIGGERGAVSLMTLAGNIVILFISILLMSIGFPALLLILAAGAGVCYGAAASPRTPFLVIPSGRNFAWLICRFVSPAFFFRNASILSSVVCSSILNSRYRSILILFLRNIF